MRVFRPVPHPLDHGVASSGHRRVVDDRVALDHDAVILGVGGRASVKAADSSRALVGIQPRWRHVPPILSSSTSATLRPRWAARKAARVAAGARAEHDEIENRWKEPTAMGQGASERLGAGNERRLGQMGHRGRWYARCPDSRNRWGWGREVRGRTGKSAHIEVRRGRSQGLSFAAHLRRRGAQASCRAAFGGRPALETLPPASASRASARPG